MKKYEYGRIGKLAEKPSEASVDPALIDQIMEGGESIRRGAKPEKKADWMRDAMKPLEKELSCEARSSALSSGGKKNCVFEFTIVEG